MVNKKKPKASTLSRINPPSAWIEVSDDEPPSVWRIAWYRSDLQNNLRHVRCRVVPVRVYKALERVTGCA
jgi:hypothetical protein